MPEAVSGRPGPPASTPTKHQEYRRLRHQGLPAVQAHQWATTRTPALRYRSGPGEKITILLDDLPNTTGFTAVASAEPDDNADLFGLGEFSDTRTANTIPVYRGDENRYEYFRPSCTLAQRRAEFSRRGYARGPAHDIALRHVREDAHQARQLEARYVRVEVRKAGVLLGEAGTDTVVKPDDDLDTTIADTVVEHHLLDEAIEMARAAVLPLIAALAS